MAQWREVRVFISSTFRDMQAERDHLVKVVFPELRERLDRHRIHFVDIDLRWGVTQEQSDNDQALELCLQQIDRCRPEEEGDRRPFFIGMLGERYGWVPHAVRPEVLERYSWIPDYPQHSVTALEIIYGVLLNPPMHGQSFFYFRDPAFMDDVPDSLRKAVLAPVNDDARRDLEALKQRIRESDIPCMENYPSRYAGVAVNWRLLRQELDAGQRSSLESAMVDGLASPDEWASLSEELQTLLAEHGTVALDGLEAFGKQVRDDLLAGIAQQYPEILQEPAQVEAGEDALVVERDAHDRFAESRLRIYVGRDDLQEELVEYLESGPPQPLVVTGPAGCGKSAALARLAADYSGDHPEALIVQHFVGASAASTSVPSMLRRLCEELQGHFRLPGELPDDPTELPGAFRALLAWVPEDARAIIILDGLDQLDERDLESGLPWLPGETPANTRLVVSCLSAPDAVLQELRGHGHPVVEVSPLSEGDCEQIIERVPSLSAKTLDESQRGLLLANPATRNALYLQVALEELRGFGSFDQLNARIAQFAEAGDVTTLFDQVLERLELDFGRPLVQDLTCLLAASRSGLSERELADLLATHAAAGDMQVVLRQLRPYLLRRDELVGYYHQSLRRAVAARYSLAQEQTQWHARLADYFETTELTPRKVQELPWELSRAKDWQRLSDLMCDLEFFAAACRENWLEVAAYWTEIENSSSLRMADAYRFVLEQPGDQSAFAIDRIATLLGRAAYTQEAQSLYSHLADRAKDSGDLHMLQNIMGRQVGILHTSGDKREALGLLDRRQQICRQLGEQDGLLETLSLQAVLLRDLGQYDQAMKLHREEEKLCRQRGERFRLQFSLGNQGVIALLRGEAGAAMELLREQERICRELGRRDTLQESLGKQALIIRDRGDNEAAMSLLREQEQICRHIGMKDSLQSCLCNQASVLYQAGDLEGTQARYDEQEALCRELGDRHALSECLVGQALLHQARGESQRALHLADEGYALAIETGNRLAAQMGLGARAAVLAEDGQPQEAIELFDKQADICRNLDYPPGLAMALANKGLLLARDMDQPQMGLDLITTARQIAAEHSLNWLEEQIRPMHEVVQEALAQTDQPSQPADEGQEALAALARQFQAQNDAGDIEGALETLSQQEALCRELGRDDGLQVNLAVKAQLLHTKGDLAAAMTALQEEATICTDRGDDESLQKCLGVQAQILQSFSQLDQAEQVLAQQEEICRRLGDKNALQGCLGERALVLQARGQLRPALRLHEQQEGLCRELDNRACLARSLGNQGLVHKHMGDLDKAMSLHQEEEQLCRELEDRDQLSRSLGNQALILARHGRLDEALQLHQETERICRELGNQEGLQACLGNQALVLCSQERFEEARPLLQEQEQICRRLGHIYGLTLALFNHAALLAQDLGDAKSALPLLQEAYELARSHGLEQLAAAAGQELPRLQHLASLQ